MSGAATEEALAVDDAATGRQNLYTDALGSVVALADPAGTVTRISTAMARSAA